MYPYSTHKLKTNYLFVYGTLRRDVQGDANQILKGDAIFISPGSVIGKLYNIGSYPALDSSDHSDSKVVGEIYKMIRPGKLLPRLDEYERCSPNFPEPHEYQRKIETAFPDDGKSVKAWTYIYNRAPTGVKRIDSGDYKAYLELREI